MNIVTPLPTTIPFTTSNVNTESARRDNAQRETIPQTGASENSASDSGLGSESDRVRTPGQAPPPVTYERPQPQTQQAQSDAQQEGVQNQGNPQDQDNAEDPSAGRESADDRQQAQQEAVEKQEVQELKDRDREVRTHEQAHAAVGGQYAGSPSYEFETGPDGRRYAVGGEVSIDISEENSPEDTVRKMEQVRAAALAPNEPSPQDFRVASEATQKAAEARAELARESSVTAQEAVANGFPDSVQGENESNERNTIGGAPDLDDIVSRGDVSGPRRSLQEADPVAEAAGLASEADAFRQQLANRDQQINQRAERIAGFYQQVSEPRQFGVQQSA
ncbi:putative metalloprotease CJM1_0395 family protein [Alteromonas sp. a30]|uniref:putative metalloprotease CJM1_0395 family protein n=1 Tax=Alteromonas sp. a30 TaxID=2730917 RepID=UPI002281F913|nr:putative metalloprotease CJM1_0395 family protein [Alteromonas sp. a30]MCY7295631.1 hypothetical protein [Alteromonas sp. a30]